MYNINYKKLKNKNGISIVLLLIGFLFLVGLGYFLFEGKYKRSKLDGVIEAFEVNPNCSYSRDADGDMSYTCYPIYHYTVDGKDYECRSSFGSGFEPSEKQNAVYYDTKDPNKCVTSFEADQHPALYLLLLVPFGCITAGIVLLVKTAKKIKSVKKLETYGVLVKDLPYELVDTHTRINNVAYYKAKIEYRFGDGTTRTLCSESMPIHDFDNRDKIDLLYDQQDNNNYYIDFNVSK